MGSGCSARCEPAVIEVRRRVGGQEAEDGKPSQILAPVRRRRGEDKIKMMVRGEIGVGARSHHELVVVLQQERPLGGVQGRGDLLRGDGEILGDLRVKEGRVRVSAVKSDRKTHVGAAVEVN